MIRRRISERFKNWFRGLNAFQVAWFYLGLAAVILLSIAHNPSEGYTREFHRRIWQEDLTERIQASRAENDEKLSEAIKKLKASGYKEFQVDGFSSYYRLPKNWAIDPRGWTSKGALSVKWLPDVPGLFDYAKLLALVVLASGGFIKLAGMETLRPRFLKIMRSYIMRNYGAAIAVFLLGLHFHAQVEEWKPLWDYDYDYDDGSILYSHSIQNPEGQTVTGRWLMLAGIGIWVVARCGLFERLRGPKSE